MAFARNEFTKRAITAAGFYTLPHVLDIYDSLVIFDARN
jgi:hypothetical protein